MTAEHVPSPPFSGAVTAHTRGLHVVVERSCPDSHVVGPVLANPSSHVGWHDFPCVSWSVQSPSFPFAGAVTMQMSGLHVVVERSCPDSHVVGPVLTKPSSHVGWHDCPCASWSVQSPSFPFAGGRLASHAFSVSIIWASIDRRRRAPLDDGSQVAGRSFPLSHFMEIVNVYPSSHTGAHDSPLTSASVGQSPGSTLCSVTTLLMSQALATQVVARRTPRSHVVGPDEAKRRSHLGWHDCPCFSVSSHVPLVAFGMSSIFIAQSDGTHLAVDSSRPCVHLVAPSTEYPTSHDGTHSSPLPRRLVQFPGPPFSGDALASHDLGWHAGGSPTVPSDLHSYRPVSS
jgi:hypothetical protein